MAKWPKDKLLEHGQELPLDERIRRYQHNIRTIRASGCAVPVPALVDTLDPAEIEMWFADNAFRMRRLETFIGKLSGLPPDAEISLPSDDEKGGKN